MGVRNSFASESQASADEFLKSITRVLKDNGLQPYIDPERPPNVYVNELFGRSALDHHSSRVLSEIASLIWDPIVCPQLALISENPYRVVFLPVDFKRPLYTGYSEVISEEATPIFAGSLPRLLLELEVLARTLKIPLDDGKLTDDIATAINQWHAFESGETSELIEDYRTAWLLLFEGSRVALMNNVALSLAG